MNKYKKTVINIILLLSSTLLTFTMAEFALRYAYKESKLLKKPMDVDLFRAAYPSVYHERLGWVPAPNTSGRENIWGTEVTIDENSLRSNRNNIRFKQKPIYLAVGDSFTFGDTVSDRETYPSNLERFTRSRVLNGGVFGYGFDQTVLRAEDLVQKYHPDALIVGFILDDLYRCQLSMRTGAYKPYFSKPPNIELKNVPVPRFTRLMKSSLKTARKSAIISLALMKISPSLYLTGTLGKVQEHNSYMEVSFYLLERLQLISTNNDNIPIILVYIPMRSKPAMEQSIAEMFKNYIIKNKLDSIRFLNIANEFLTLPEEQFLSFYSQFHLNITGNYVVAKRIAMELDTITKN